jgi:hypothetical protein
VVLVVAVLDVVVLAVVAVLVVGLVVVALAVVLVAPVVAVATSTGAVVAAAVFVSVASGAAATAEAVTAIGSGETAIQNPPKVRAVRTAVAQRAGALFRLVLRRVCAGRATRATGDSGTAAGALVGAVRVSCVGIISSSFRGKSVPRWD